MQHSETLFFIFIFPTVNFVLRDSFLVTSGPNNKITIVIVIITPSAVNIDKRVREEKNRAEQTRRDNS